MRILLILNILALIFMKCVCFVPHSLNLNGNLKPKSEFLRNKTCLVRPMNTRSFLTCSVDLAYYKNVEKEGPEGCHSERDNNLIVVVNQLFENISFICTSNTPLDVEILFEYGAAIVHYTEVKRERIVENNYNQTSSYNYKLTIIFPTSPIVYGLSKNTTAVQYKVVEIGSDVHVNIIFYVLEHAWNLEANIKVHWMNENLTIEARNEIIHIPCISLSKQIWLFRLTKESYLYEVHKEAYDYDIHNGLSINTTSYESIEGYYVCSTQKLNNGGIILWDGEIMDSEKFKIVLPNDFFIEPATNIVDHNILFDLQHIQQNFSLICSSQSRNVEIVIDRNVFRSGNLEVTIVNTVVERPVKRIVSQAILSYISWDECKKDWTGRNCLHDVIFIKCIDSDSNKDLHFWDVRTKQSYTEEEYENFAILPLRYDKKEENFICDPVLYSARDFSIQHIHCSNEFQCRQLTPCLLYVGKDKNDLDGRNKGCILAQTTFAKTPCQQSASDSGSQYQLNCDVAKPLVSSKGVLQCFITKGDGSYDFFQDIYFQGFDKKLYGNERAIPLNATLELVKLHNNENLNTGGKFRFRCQAHSFFFEEGLVWLFEYVNGNGSSSLQQIPPEYINYISSADLSSEDLRHSNDNVISTVEITFHTESIKQVACAAPVMYSKAGWHLVFTNVNVKNSVAPEITTGNTTVAFRVGDKGRSIRCRADGFPPPEINWTFNGNDIEAPLEVVDHVVYKLVLFPTFNETMIGEYTCTSTNIAGFDTMVFRVNSLVTDDDNALDATSMLPYMWGLVGILLASIIFISILFSYLRIRKNERFKQLKAITEMLYGQIKKSENGNKSEEIHDPVIALPYNKTFELKKDSFLIDRRKLLGRGNYGEVYKGRIEGRDGFCAFKTLKCDSTVSDLRSLVYELKILNYIGRHENIVQLVGAYTKDILEGVIHIATELCSLGSIKDYLRSNRETFIQNIQRMKKGNITEQQNISICSVQRLVIWSMQIATALEYLVSKRVIHGDLAARNVLLTADGATKVTDFGMSRRTDADFQYIKKSDDVVPWQWLAIECIKRNTFSAESDVWAYGITLWEIFSLGNIPYPAVQTPCNSNDTISFWRILIDHLENGLQNTKPRYSSPKIYDIMKSCWNIDPKSRPSFTSLKMEFQNILANGWMSTCSIFDVSEANDPNNTETRTVFSEHSNPYLKLLSVLPGGDSQSTAYQRNNHNYVPCTFLK